MADVAQTESGMFRPKLILMLNTKFKSQVSEQSKVCNLNERILPKKIWALTYLSFVLRAEWALRGEEKCGF